MSYIKYFTLTVLLFAVAPVFVGCHSASNKSMLNTTTIKTDTIKSLPATGADTIKKVIPVSRNITMNDLLAHFKPDAGFPLVVDSAYIANMSKKDSLGTSEMKMLKVTWCVDSLVLDDSGSMNDFYKIDSLKAVGVYAKWEDTLSDYTNVVRSNAYGLKKVTLQDGTVLLVWALNYSDGCDPLYDITNVYATVFTNNKPGKTILFGEYASSVDPPAYGETIVKGKLTADGKMKLEKYQLSCMGDTNVAQVDHGIYNYAIANGHISFVSDKVDATKNVKVVEGEE